MKRSSVQVFRNFISLTLFGMAMGFLETIVVVYLRNIYYPQGFHFPLTSLSHHMLIIEWLREAATIIMLATIGIIAGKNNLSRFSFFLYTFAIWDIFYYVWLKALINWPPSLLTWDVLFLIPVPWIGPVLAPVICSLTMILFAAMIIFLQKKGFMVKIKLSEWGLIFIGVFFILYTFVKDYIEIIIREMTISNSSSLATNEHFWKTLTQYQPSYFNWYLFILGIFAILIALLLLFKRTMKQTVFTKNNRHSENFHLVETNKTV